MKSQTWGLFPAIALAVALAASCGGKDAGGSADQASGSGGEAVEKSEDMTPAQLGDAIGNLYTDNMSKLVERLKAMPAAADVMADIESMRGECITRMVALGKQREALDAAGRSAVDAAILSKMNALYNTPVFASFNDIQQHYFQDQQLHKLIMDFNIITQYANYDLLKKQSPEEAARLGIK